MKIGPTFADELRAAGGRLDGLSWNAETGAFTFSGAWNDAEKAQIAVVFLVHNPLAVSAETARLAEIEVDALARDLTDRLKAATAQQIKDYVAANVTDLASARAIITKFALVMARLVK